MEIPCCNRPTEPGLYLCFQSGFGVNNIKTAEVFRSDEDKTLRIHVGDSVTTLDKISKAIWWGPIILELSNISKS